MAEDDGSEIVWMNAKDAAHILKVSEVTAHRWSREGSILRKNDGNKKKVLLGIKKDAKGNFVCPVRRGNFLPDTPLTRGQIFEYDWFTAKQISSFFNVSIPMVSFWAKHGLVPSRTEIKGSSSYKLYGLKLDASGNPIMPKKSIKKDMPELPPTPEIVIQFFKEFSGKSVREAYLELLKRNKRNVAEYDEKFKLPKRFCCGGILTSDAHFKKVHQATHEIIPLWAWKTLQAIQLSGLDSAALTASRYYLKETSQKTAS